MENESWVGRQIGSEVARWTDGKREGGVEQWTEREREKKERKTGKR